MRDFSIFKQTVPAIEIDAKFRSTNHFKDLDFWTTRTVKVLVVVDTAVGFDEFSGFGVGRFIKLLRETRVGCTRFEVHIAHRPFVFSPDEISFEEVASPGDFEAKYIDFRFDSQSNGELVLNRYHEVFLFGFAPDNSAGPDSNISEHPWYSTDSELQVLSEWMNQGGGVFATGDHDYLGASMCERIPRVGTMRKWTNADGVPPIDGITRLDTNRPATSGEENGIETIENSNESDAIPQVIDWVPERVIRQGLFRYKYPHPLLCHPTHGPINVMPDHPHEGMCNNPDQIDYTSTVAFGSDLEYPTFNGVQPRPKIIAYGVIKPKLNHAKGAVNGAYFPMISAYDGRSNGSTVGRIVVDSTWHHWFNMNLIGLENATDKTNWEKISRYFINIALWIAPQNIRGFCYWELIKLHFEYSGIREINPDTTLLETGSIVRNTLWNRFGKCWTTEFILKHICDVRPQVCKLYKKFDPRDELDWPKDIRDIVQPQFDLIETVVLGSVYRSIEPIADKLRTNMSTRNAESSFVFTIEEMEETTYVGVEKALDMISSQATREFSELRAAFE